MRFCWYTPDVSRSANVLLVGSSEGRVKNLSAWPGQRTPRRLRARTAVESALRLAEDRSRRLWLSGIDWVTMAHFDGDSLLAAWAVLRPELAQRHAAAVVAAAEAAAFERFTTAAGVQFDLTLRALEDPLRSPLAAEMAALPADAGWERLSQAALDLLPGALLQPAAYRSLWQEPWLALERANAMLGQGEIEIRESAGVSLVQLNTEVPWRVLFTATSRDCVLAARRVIGGWTYEMRFRPESWYDLPGAGCCRRRDCSPLVEIFNALEGRSGTLWQAVPTDYLCLAGCYTGLSQERLLLPSSLAPEAVAEMVAGFLTMPGQQQHDATG